MAVGTLTIIPSGSFTPTPRAVRIAMLTAPLAVLPLAGVAALGVVAGRAIGAPHLLVGAAVAGWLFIGTRGMHLDGTADVVDALAAGWDRPRAIEVMKRGDVGPMGAAALTLVIVAQIVAWGEVTQRPAGWLVAGAAIVASRVGLTIPCAQGIPAMRGSTMGKVMAGSVPRWAAGLSWLIAVIVVASAAAYAGIGWPTGVVAVVAAGGCCLGLVAKMLRLCGGINGDVMGACIELGLTVMAVILACG